MSNDVPEIESEYSPTHKKIQVGGLFGGVMSGGIDAIIYSEDRDIVKALEFEPIAAGRTKLKRTIECTLFIDPMRMKSIYQWLGEKIQEYEKLFGRIPSPEELESRANRES